MRKLLKRAFDRGWFHWAIVVAIILASVAATPAISRWILRDAQSRVFQKFGEMTPRPLKARNIRFVMIDDDTYTAKPLSARVPIRRDYVATIVDELSKAGAAVIAVDFDFRIRHPVSRGPLPSDDADYDGEVALLVKAVVQAAEKHRVVLPKVIKWDKRRHRYVLGLDNYQRFGICTRLKADGVWESPGPGKVPLPAAVQANINCGYIQLTRERRMLPPALDVEHDGRVDSFGLAVARAWDPAEAQGIGDYPAYATFLSPSLLEDRLLQSGRPRPTDIVITTTQLFAHDPDALRIVQNRPVIVGARWRIQQQPDQFIDMHDTPAGPENGSLIHASYSEAILDGRVYSELPHWLQFVLEVAISLVAAILMAAYSRHFWVKLAVPIGFGAGFLIVQWVMMIGAATVFDALIPLLFLLLHSLIEEPIQKRCRPILEALQSRGRNPK